MNGNQNIVIPIGSERSLYWIAFLFPTISVFSCMGINYYLEHSKGLGIIPTISLFVVEFPENRIFPICMNVEILLLSIIFYVRQSMIKNVGERKQLNKSFFFRFANFVSSILAVIICVSLSGLSLITLIDHRNIHLIFSGFFFLSILFYYIISDICGYKAGLKIKLFSFFVPYLTILLILFYLLVLVKYLDSVKKEKMMSLGAICQFIGSFLIFLKIMLIGYDYPPHNIISGTSKIKFV